MADAGTLYELVRAGLRNPANVVVKVQSKNTRTGLKLVEEKRGALNNGISLLGNLYRTSVGVHVDLPTGLQPSEHLPCLQAI